MREQYMRTGEGFIICYSVTDRRSFEEATAYKRLVDRVRNSDDVPIVLVGNKCDLQLERQVKISSEVKYSVSQIYRTLLLPVTLLNTDRF